MNKLKLLSTFLLLSTIFSLTSCSNIPSTSTDKLSEDYLLALTELDVVDFHTELQKSYLNDEYSTVLNYAKGDKEESRPNAVYFEWEAICKKQEASDIKNYKLMISEDESFSKYLSFTTSETFFDVYNLKIATTYYWKVVANLADGYKVVSEVDEFKTMEYGPRNLYVDGVTNVRDLGGWNASEGRVKQDMIFRSGRFNKSESDKVEVEVTFEGIDTMLNILNVKSEIDLRRVDNNEIGSITSSPISEDVNYFSCPMNWEGSNILLDNVEMVKKVFTILADQNNYPIVYHCNIGTDRTGLFAYLINGLLGVSEKDLYTDYLFSNFGLINGTREIKGIEKSYVATVKSYQGTTLSEKIQNCLIDLGIKENHIKSIKEIMGDSN